MFCRDAPRCVRIAAFPGIGGRTSVRPDHNEVAYNFANIVETMYLIVSKNKALSDCRETMRFIVSTYGSVNAVLPLRSNDICNVFESQYLVKTQKHTRMWDIVKNSSILSYLFYIPRKHRNTHSPVYIVSSICYKRQTLYNLFFQGTRTKIHCHKQPDNH